MFLHFVLGNLLLKASNLILQDPISSYLCFSLTPSLLFRTSKDQHLSYEGVASPNLWVDQLPVADGLGPHHQVHQVQGHLQALRQRSDTGKF